MMRRTGVGAGFALVICGCVSQHAMPMRYDLDGIQAPPRIVPRLDATIALAPIQAPSWLRSTALVYRLDYTPPDNPRAYTLSEWTAPPGELLTLRLRERIAAANDGFTLTTLPEDANGYRLNIVLENFTQIFSSPDHSRCVVTLAATVLGHEDRIVAQRTFRSQAPAPSANAVGAVEGLGAAADSDFDQILAWLRGTLPVREASAITGAGSPAQ